MWVEVLGLKNSLLKDEHLRHLLRFNENDGMQALHTPRWNLKQSHLKATMSTQVVEVKVGTNANGATVNQGFMMASTSCLKHIKNRN